MMDTAKPPLAGHKRKSLAKILVSKLSQNITDAIIKQGEKLPTESQIMKTHNVSRTVVREAISRLQAVGLVETRQGVGTFVLAHRNTHGLHIDPATIVTLRDVINVLEFRASIEVEAAGLTAKRCNDEDLALMRNALDEFNQALQSNSAVASDFRFHYLIALATGNRYFADIMSHIGLETLPRTRVDSAQLTRSNPVQYQARLVREHEEIYEAIARRDSDAARAAMSVHLTNSRERLLEAKMSVSNRDED